MAETPPTASGAVLLAQALEAYRVGATEIDLPRFVEQVARTVATATPPGGTTPAITAGIAEAQASLVDAIEAAAMAYRQDVHRAWDTDVLATMAAFERGA